MQSHTDILSSTTTSLAPTQLTKKLDGRWDHGSLTEPLRINVPQPPPLVSFSTSSPSNHTPLSIKGEHHSLGSASHSSSSSSSGSQKSISKTSKKGNSKSNKTINDCILNLHQQHQNNLKNNKSLSILTTTITTTTKEQTGCSRTVPLSSWSQSNKDNATILCKNSTISAASLLQIKREPCQVSEVTTSNNNLGPSTPTTSFPALIKIEQNSPTNCIDSSPIVTTTSSVLTSSSSTMDTATTTSGQNTSKYLFI